MAMITATDLSLGYDSHIILEHLSFSVEEGDYLCIVGENGAGKSTLMKTLLGLTTPLAGSVTFGDGLSRREIGYLPQQTPVQRDFPASVYEIVISGCQARAGLRPFYNKEEKALAEEAMETLQITELRKQCYRELSGGQQQRVLLARALCATRKLLLLDEPTAGLDPKVTMELYALVDRLNESGITILMISHDIVAATHTANKILHIGEHIFFGTAKEYEESEIGAYFLQQSEPAVHAGVRPVIRTQKGESLLRKGGPHHD